MPEKIESLDEILNPTPEKEGKQQPILPDGTVYQVKRAECRLEAFAIIENIKARYSIGPEHTHPIRIILDATMRIRDLEADIKDKKRKPSEAEIKVITELERHIYNIYEKMGLLQRTTAGEDPYTLWENHIKPRAKEYLEERGLGSVIACKKCGHFILPYIFPLPKDVKIDPQSHPWLNDERYPIWSNRIWAMQHQECGHECECGKKCKALKLTREEGAWILEVSDIGLDQLEQQWLEDHGYGIDDDGMPVLLKQLYPGDEEEENAEEEAEAGIERQDNQD